MSEEEFKAFISRFTFRDGAVMNGPDRHVLVHANFLVGIHREMEAVLGPDGAFAVIHNAAMRGGEFVAEQLAKQVGPAPIEQVIKMIHHIGTLIGWGKFTVVEFNEQPVLLRTRHDNSYITGFWEGASEGKCLFVSSIVGIVIPILKKAGLATELEYEEHKCVAKGDSHCEFVVQERKEV
jgi:hypothetical protein